MCPTVCTGHVLCGYTIQIPDLGDEAAPLLLERLLALWLAANMARIRQSSPDSGLDLQVKVVKTLQAVPSLLESGAREVIPGAICFFSFFSLLLSSLELSDTTVYEP